MARKYALGMKFVGKAVGMGVDAEGRGEGEYGVTLSLKLGCVGACVGDNDGLKVEGAMVGLPGNGDGLAVGAREGSPREGEGVGERLVTTICPPQVFDKKQPSCRLYIWHTAVEGVV